MSAAASSPGVPDRACVRPHVFRLPPATCTRNSQNKLVMPCHREEVSSRRLGIAHVRTLKMQDDVLCVRVSPNGTMLVPQFKQLRLVLRCIPDWVLALCVPSQPFLSVHMVIAHACHSRQRHNHLHSAGVLGGIGFLEHVCFVHEKTLAGIPYTRAFLPD